LLKERKKYYLERDAHKLLFGLFPQVFGIHQKQDTTGIGKFQQTVNCGDGGEGFPASGSHLNQGAGFGIPKIGKTGDDPGAFISFFMVEQVLRWL